MVIERDTQSAPYILHVSTCFLRVHVPWLSTSRIWLCELAPAGQMVCPFKEVLEQDRPRGVGDKTVTANHPGKCSMSHCSNPRRLLTHVLLGLAALLVFSIAPTGTSLNTAQAQSVSIEFRSALDPYGNWRRHERWGDVWVPASVDRSWRPYTVGRWVYSDDYGWYWVAAEREARWGWVVYHYGRWVRDGELGWVWVPGREWAPAWVSWRRGHDHIGWAPLPPDRLVVTYYDEPDVWIFVEGRRFTASVVADFVVPLNRQPIFLDRTVVVNRTVLLNGGGPAFAVNPGIAPSVVAAAVGQPLNTYQVRPIVVAGTAPIPNAVTVEASDLQQGAPPQVAAREVVQETQAKVEPARQVPEPKPLAQNEDGRLGENPPQAARRASQQRPGQATTGETATEQQPDGAQGRAAGQDQKGEDKATAQERADPDKAATQDTPRQPDDKSTAEGKPGQAEDRAATQEKEQQAKDRAAAQDKAEQAKDKAAAQDKAEQARDQAAAQEKAEQAKDRAATRGKAAQEKAERARDRAATQSKAAQEKAEQAKDRAATQRQERQRAAPGRPDQQTEGRRAAPPAARPDRSEPRGAGRTDSGAAGPPRAGGPAPQRPAAAAPAGPPRVPAAGGGGGPQTEGRGGGGGGGPAQRGPKQPQ